MLNNVFRQKAEQFSKRQGSTTKTIHQVGSLIKKVVMERCMPFRIRKAHCSNDGLFILEVLSRRVHHGINQHGYVVGTTHRQNCSQQFIDVFKQFTVLRIDKRVPGFIFDRPDERNKICCRISSGIAMAQQIGRKANRVSTRSLGGIHCPISVLENFIRIVFVANK